MRERAGMGLKSRPRADLYCCGVAIRASSTSGVAQTASAEGAGSSEQRGAIVVEGLAAMLL